jgi:hypothetical protein
MAHILSGQVMAPRSSACNKGETMWLVVLTLLVAIAVGYVLGGGLAEATA